jgi:hypothetical protein
MIFMSIRQQVSKYSGTVTLLAVACLVIAIGATVRVLSAGSQPATPDKTQFFFYDPDSASLSTLPTPLSPATQDNRQLYRAYVYSCSSCADSATRFVGYIEKLSPQRYDKESQMRSGLLPGEELRPAARAELHALAGLFISSPTPLAWVSPDSPEAASIQSALVAKCPGKLFPCTPGASAQ